MVGAVFVVVEVLAEEIGEEEELYHHEEEEKFGKDYYPKGLPYGHVAETVVVKRPDFPRIVRYCGRSAS